MTIRTLLISSSLPYACYDGEAKDLFPHVITETKDISWSVLGSPSYRICGLPRSLFDIARYLQTNAEAWTQPVALIRGITGTNVVIVMLSVNDIESPSLIVTEIHRFYRSLQTLALRTNPGSPYKICVISPINTVNGEPNPTLRPELQTWCQQNGQTFIKGYELLDAVAENFTDGVHFSVVGHAQMAERLTTKMISKGLWPA